MITAQFNIHELKLRQGEQLVSVMRKHWFILFREVIIFKFLFAVPLVALLLIPVYSTTAEVSAFIIFFSALWMLLMLMIIFTVWTSYYLDIWIVTNQRIMDIEQKTLFNREVKTLRMETVQDVQTDTSGIIEEFLRFGTLRVQTAGTGGTDAKIVGIPHTSAERDIIMKQVHLINRAGTVSHSGMKMRSPEMT